MQNMSKGDKIICCNIMCNSEQLKANKTCKKELSGGIIPVLPFTGLVQPRETPLTKYVCWHGDLFMIDIKWRKQVTKL